MLNLCRRLLGLGAGLFITQEIREAEQRATQAENDKKEAERRQKEAEKKIADEEKRKADEEQRKKDLEQQKLEEQLQKAAAAEAQARKERQELAAEKERIKALARQAQSTVGGTSYATIGGKSGSKNIRSGPGTAYSVVSQGYTGDSIEILDSQSDSGGYKWYKIYHSSSGTTGWIAAQLVDF